MKIMKKIAFVGIIGVTLLTGTVSMATIFPDTSDHWASEAVDNVTNKGIMIGYPDGSFRPQNNITRAEFLKLTSNIIKKYTKLEKRPVPNPLDLNYVWITDDDISNVVGNGIMEGYPDGSFRPSNNITRAEIAITVFKMIKVINPNYDFEQIKNTTFPDIANNWAKDSIEILTNSGIINGYMDESFKPNSEVTRAEITAILNNISLILEK